MKKLGALPFLFLIACSSGIRVYTDSDPAYDLKTFHSYDWLEKTNIEATKDPVYYNELNDKRIKSAVELELATHGYVLTDSFPELILHYHIMIDDKEGAIPEHEADSYGPYWQRPPSVVYSYKEGTLIIDIMDARNNLVWRGSASAPIEEVYSPEKTTKLIKNAVTKMFRTFPAGKSVAPGSAESN